MKTFPKTTFYIISIDFIFITLIFLSCNTALQIQPQKKQSVFFSDKMLNQLHQQVKSDAWVKSIADSCIKLAAPWRAMTDDELWSSVFGSTISRSWMVWSNGYCPGCKESVAMYNWKIEPFKPWKVQCPHCSELFPKNDFYAYYQSGLDEHGVFNPTIADTLLLFNKEHPDKIDPLHQFGVDDGEGYVNGENRWRFIGFYLIQGQWKRLIYSGIVNLAAAYMLTGDSVYAHKAGILLDRIADLYPTFDFNKQGYSYEKQDPIIGQGYISVWHDACYETREMTLAFDLIFDALKKDKELVNFLSAKALKYKLPNPKSSFANIQTNIEDRILKDALKNRYKIESNFPQTEVTNAIIETVLNWPEQRSHVMEIIDQFVSKGVDNDGLSGEKGLAGYSSGFPRTMAQFLALYNNLEPGFLTNLFTRHPNLHKTFRFHIDTWINESYYPKVGDMGAIGQKSEKYAGAQFFKNPIQPNMSINSFQSMYSFFWELYELTDDPAYVQILFKENDNRYEGLPYNIFENNPQQFQQNVRQVIDSAGTQIQVASVNKEKWCLVILRSGKNENSRALWLDYDIGGNHCHADGMNIGLFAKGLDILPGFGYPPVQFGGWYSPKALWYRMTAAHNTVVVDGQSQMPNAGEKETEPLKVQLNPLKKHVAGQTTLWGTGQAIKIIRASGAQLYQRVELKQYERTVALIDISEQDAYILDIFRVIGGIDHAKFMHGYFGDISTIGLNLSPIADYGFDTQMRNFRGDASPDEGWSVTWHLKDFYKYLPQNAAVHLRYTDLTRKVSAAIAETWIAFGFSNSQVEWLPSLMIRNQGEKGPLATTFLGVIEPFEEASNIKSIKRLDLFSRDNTKYSDMNAALEITFIDGRKDLILAVDVENPMNIQPSFLVEKEVRLPELNLSTNAEFCFIRMNPSNKIERMVLAKGSFLNVGNSVFELSEKTDFVEMEFAPGEHKIVTGNKNLIKAITN
ncbi:heparinase II/III family protein [candidate division KSB1 bacterium]|nr:heparinase II/III family protein [candidate division KSB1 bacterium]